MYFTIYKFCPFNNKSWYIRKVYIVVVFGYCPNNAFCIFTAKHYLIFFYNNFIAYALNSVSNMRIIN